MRHIKLFTGLAAWRLGAGQGRPHAAQASDGYGGPRMEWTDQDALITAEALVTA
ncbi:MAG: hypothetical protein NZU63_12875 [Gemmataceae bacterium]|nr:hypothetical protein [Gemmataceae bacterium]